MTQINLPHERGEQGSATPAAGAGKGCNTCKHAENGLLSGMQYCRACPDETWPLFTHQMRLQGSPCGPLGLLYETGEPASVVALIGCAEVA